MKLPNYKKILVPFFVLIYIQSASAQRNFVSMGQSVDGVPIMVEYDIGEEDNKIDGSPYLFDEWKHFNIRRKTVLSLKPQLQTIISI